MATKTRNISLPPALDQFVDQRVKAGLYGNASNVIQAGLRALVREEMAGSLKKFEEIMATLPQDPITPKIEQDIVRRINRLRIVERKANAKGK